MNFADFYRNSETTRANSTINDVAVPIILERLDSLQTVERRHAKPVGQAGAQIGQKARRRCKTVKYAPSAFRAAPQHDFSQILAASRKLIRDQNGRRSDTPRNPQNRTCPRCEPMDPQGEDGIVA